MGLHACMHAWRVSTCLPRLDERLALKNFFLDDEGEPEGREAHQLAG